MHKSPQLGFADRYGDKVLKLNGISPVTFIQRDKCDHKLDPFGIARYSSCVVSRQPDGFPSKPVFHSTKIWVYKVGAIHFRERGEGKRKRIDRNIVFPFFAERGKEHFPKAVEVEKRVDKNKQAMIRNLTELQSSYRCAGMTTRGNYPRARERRL